jgi:hypothetical protein
MTEMRHFSGHLSASWLQTSDCFFTPFLHCSQQGCTYDTIFHASTSHPYLSLNIPHFNARPTLLVASVFALYQQSLHRCHVHSTRNSYSYCNTRFPLLLKLPSLSHYAGLASSFSYLNNSLPNSRQKTEVVLTLIKSVSGEVETRLGWMRVLAMEMVRLPLPIVFSLIRPCL